jgi:hypothetical protein
MPANPHEGSLARRADMDTDDEGPHSPNGSDAPQQAVIASFRLSDASWGDPEDFADLEDVEDRLMQVIGESGVGEFDGIGRGMGCLDVYMYGPSADALLAVVESILRNFPANPGSFVVKRYGAPGMPEVRIDL